MDNAELANVLVRLGCPAEKSAVMAAQLDKRAQMDAERKGIPYAAALQHLTALMAQGWAAGKS
jgi:predicted metal-dependent hydrolase